MAMPGDFIAHAEERIGGEGTLEEEGNVYAAVPGKLSINEDLTASVKNPKTVRMLAKGDEVVGVVMDIYASIALIRFQPLSKNLGASNTYAYIRISELQRGYTEDFRDFIRIGDYVRAKIKEVTPMGIYLTLAQPGLGVIRAFCPRCRNQMKDYTCPKCSFADRRKTGVHSNHEKDYGRKERVQHGFRRNGPRTR